MSAGDETRPATSRRGPRTVAVERVGPYRIEGELGRGGMGVVYRAFDERLQRAVALKALPAEVASDVTELTRMEREARALAAVSHRHVATIHGLEEGGGTLWLVMELVDGETMRQRLDHGALPLSEALSLCEQVAAGIDAVHRQGLVHLDLKPGNVMVTREGLAKLLDFGLARRSEPAVVDDAQRHGEIAGTPGYMSPEQVSGEVVDARSDAWAWGCLLFECLAGCPPFAGRGAEAAATLSDEPAWDRLPDGTPQDVLDLLKACLAKARADRPATMEEVRSRLEAARQASSGRAVAALPKHHLPAERDAFVGREAELAELARLLQQGHRLVSVLGIGGTGKTRLALRFAWTHLNAGAGGTWFCDLSEATSVDGIAHAVATALDVPLGKGDPVVQLGHALAGRGKCLVILDNFEQVARHAAATLGRWLDRAPEASFIVTTREVLGLVGEQSLALAPLPQADAEALFIERAQQARSDYEPDAPERAVIAHLVRLLDCLPLAIELAAARVRVMPAAHVLARMGERFKMLAGTGVRRDRHVTLRATLDSSWELLCEWEKHALAQISVFQGGLTLEAAEAVLDLSAWPQAPWAVDAVQGLLDKSLLRRAGADRLDMLVSVQQYAAEKLDELGGREAAERRHGAWCAAFGTEEALEALARRGGVQKLRALARELDNLVAACRRAVARNDAEVAAATLSAAWAVLELCGPLAAADGLAAAVSHLALPAVQRARVEHLRGEALWLLGRGVEARACHEAALALARDLGERRREGQVLGDLGTLHAEQGRMGEARACHEAALALARESGDRRGEGRRLVALAIVHLDQGRMDEGRACLDAALTIAREVGDARTEGRALGNLGNACLQHGRMDEARACYESALAIHREAGDGRSESRVLGNIGNANYQQGRMDEARACFNAALSIARAVGDRRGEGVVLGNLGNAHFEQGRMDEARACYESALAVHREGGEPRPEAIVLGNLGSLHAEQGRADEARACFEAALVIHRSVGDRRSEGHALGNLGALHSAQGRLDEARTCLDAALAVHREVGNRRVEGVVLGNLGNLHLQQGRMEEARACYDAGERLLREVDDPVELGLLLSCLARFEHAAGRAEAACAALSEAEGLAARAGAGADSEFGRKLAEAHAVIDGAAASPAR